MAWFWGTVRKAIYILPLLSFHLFLPLFFLSSFSKSLDVILIQLHIPIASQSFHLIGKRKLPWDSSLIACLPLLHGRPSHQLLLVLVRKISLLFYHCRRTGRVGLTSLPTILSHPALPKCILLIRGPRGSKWTFYILDPNGSLTVNGETREAFHYS